MFRVFEKLLTPTADPSDATPPKELTAFYLHFARQARGLLIALFAVGSLVALLDLLIPLFLGKVVELVSSHSPAELFRDYWPHLLGMAAIQLFLRPLTLFAQNLIVNQGIAANLTNLVRWQSHWHVLRQGWAFFRMISRGGSPIALCRQARPYAKASFRQPTRFGTSSCTAAAP